MSWFDSRSYVDQARDESTLAKVIYLDIYNLFLDLLSLLSGRRR